MLKKIYTAFLIFILLVSAIVAFSSLNLPNSIKFLAVQSGSMEPAIKVGSIVIIKPTSVYKVNDIITVSDSANKKVTVTHRINEIKIVDNKKVYITKGNANKTSDSEIRHEEDIVGKVYFSIPLLGYPVEFARTKAGLIFLIIIPAVIIIYSELIKIKNHAKTIFPNLPLLLVILLLASVPLSKSNLADNQKVSSVFRAAVWETVKLDFYFMNDQKEVGFKVYGPELPKYTKIDYLITYDSDQGIQGISGTKNINGADQIVENNLILGTCSSGGTCSYNSGIRKVKITIKFDEVDSTIISSSLEK